MRHLDVLVYDLQIVICPICPGSLTGKPDSHIIALGDKEKIPLISNLKKIDEHTESIYGTALCVNSSFNVFCSACLNPCKTTPQSQKGFVTE